VKDSQWCSRQRARGAEIMEARCVKLLSWFPCGEDDS